MRATLMPIPGDSIQAMCANDEFLAVSSWDLQVHIYDIKKKVQVTQFKMPSLVLSLQIFGRDLYCGCADGWIYKRDIQQSQPEEYFRVSGAVRTLCMYKTYLIATSLACELVSINIQNKERRVHEILKERVFASSVRDDRFLAACARRSYLLYKLVERDGALSFQLERERESPLRHQTRSCCLSVDGNAILGSVEGRVAVESQEPFAFRAHRVARGNGGGFLDHPVNAMAVWGKKTLFTAGSDGAVYAWDLAARRKVYKVQESYAVANILIHNNMLFVAKSYNWENREQGRKDEQRELVTYDITGFGLES